MLTIHTDGSSRPRTTECAGWAFVTQIRDKTHVVYGHLPAPSTNNIGELLALIRPLRLFGKGDTPLLFITDSQYVQKGIVEYMKGWKHRGWKTSAGAKVKNLELWKEVYSLWDETMHTVKWERGHSGEPNNELADVWANAGSDNSTETIDLPGLCVRRSNG